MAIGAQGYSIGDAIRTLLGQVLDVMYFKKWLTIVQIKGRVQAAALANSPCLLTHPGPYYRIAYIGCAGCSDLLRRSDALGLDLDRFALKLCCALLK
ncbi:hypothetical protein TX23_23100 [Pseudomonas paralactis]|uniref:Uncharacterized protein n=1 Tax=Pseudomonas paralactis TaxID=1615673 RepID=A0A0R3A7W2_9PSED|nr:hypothetical protein TX23_23100 [Pseudomonas paralactis]